MTIEEIFPAIKQKIEEALGRSRAEGILLSGGIDSGILAYLYPQAKAITVSLEGRGRDEEYACSLATTVGLAHTVITIDLEEALVAAREVVRILESFDPALPNDVVVYFGMKEAKRQGLSSMMTGDGADELLGGYSYMLEIEDLDGYIRRISRSMSFSSERIGHHFGIDVKRPYLDETFINFALTLKKEVKIREEKGHVWGKWVLRKAFEPFLPLEFIWQHKRPLEVGSGMAFLRQVIAGEMSDEEFEQKKMAYPVNFLCKEHLYFYEIYCEEVGDIPPPQAGEGRCPGCGAGMSRGQRHCKVCGWVR